MSDWDMKIIAEEARRLIAMSAQDADLRAELRALAETILEATECPPAASAPAAEPARAPDEPATPEDAGDAEPPAPEPLRPAPRRPVLLREREPLRELTLGQRTAPPISPPSPAGRDADRETDEDELEQIEARCRAKAESVRWQAESHRRLWEGVETPVEDDVVGPEMFAWADHLVQCFYFLDDQDASHKADLSLLDDVAGCFEAVAEAVRLMARADSRRGAIERALPLMAEGQSMLRRALQRLRAPDDPDQLAVYRKVRDAAARHRIYVRKYMRADELADPSNWPGLLARIEAVAASGQQSAQQKERIGRLKELVERVRQGAATDEDWRAVVETVDAMIGEGVPPSNREIRDLLLPVIDDLPDRDDLPAGFRLVLREFDRYMATRMPPPKTTNYVPPPEVKEAARLLGGRSVVLIGGARRREPQAALKKALGLKDLIWIETKEHQSIESFETVIARPDVALILLAIRWSSHAFGEVRQYCIQHEKPLVRLPGGYGPHQVAVQVLAQASEWLGERKQ